MKLDQSEYKEEEEGEGEERRVRGTKRGAPDNNALCDRNGPCTKRRGRPAPLAPPAVATAPTAATAAATTAPMTAPADAPLCQRNLSTYRNVLIE